MSKTNRNFILLFIVVTITLLYFLYKYNKIIHHNQIDILVSNKIEKPIIKVNVSKIENNVIVKIKDNANEINEEIIDRIFEPYFTTKGKGNGTEIGLYMSKLIIEKNMNGKLTVKNDNNGAVFIITLNITKQEI